MILIPSKGPEDWRNLLADPQLQWRRGYSAASLAYCWEEAKGFPESVRQVFEASDYPFFKELEPLLVIPEYKVNLPGGSAASQNDIFVLARSPDGFLSIMVEGKVSEPFGPLVSEWYRDPSPGKVTRLQYLCEILGLDENQVQNVRYQLLHRTASALIEAKRFDASFALMLVHSFSQTDEWHTDYADFASLYGINNARPGAVHYTGSFDGVDLYLAWVKGEERYLEMEPER